MQVGIQLHLSEVHALAENVASVENDPMSPFRKKPKYGFWTSTWREETQDSDWVEWCRGQDFEQLAQSYDGLRLTERGNSRLHLSYPLDLNSWDSESTLWFRWCFTAVEKIVPVIAQEV